MDFIDELDGLFNDNCSSYKTEPNGNGRYPTQLEWWKFLEQVKEMRSAQKDNRTSFDFNSEEDFTENQKRKSELESRVDEMIKELFK
jgi:hypothetical protein